VIKDDGTSGRKYDMCTGNNEGRCYDEIFYPGFPSVPAKPQGPLGPGNGDSQSLQIDVDYFRNMNVYYDPNEVEYNF